MPKRNRLRIKRLDSVGLVDAGANAGSHVLISKRRDDEEETELDRLFEDLAKQANVGAFMEAMLHRDFTVAADDRYASGLLTREERIALSNSIGAALDAFRANLEEVAPDLYERDPWELPEEMTKSSNAHIISNGPPAESEEEPAMPENDTTLPEETVAGLPEEVREHIEDLEKRLAAATAEPPAPEPLEKRDDVPDEVKAEIAKMKAEQEADRAEVAKLREERAQETALAKAKRFPTFAGDKTTELAGILRKMEAALDEDEAEVFEGLVRAAEEKLETSAMFEELGSLGQSTDAERALEERARKRATENNISFEKAYAEELRDAPADVRNEIAKRGREVAK